VNKARWARVLIVEDSPTAARLLVNGISRDPRLAVAGVALTATEAATLAEQLQPDVITVDLMLPDETGLDVILRVLRKRYIPIIVVTALPQNGSNLAFRSLLAGAADVILKPIGDAKQLSGFFEDLNERIASLAAAVLVPTHKPAQLRRARSKPAIDGAPVECVVVGASTGGPTALVEFLSALGPDFPAPVVVVQHIAAPFVQGLVKWLNQETPLPVKLATDGEVLEQRVSYVAPAGADLHIKRGGRLSVTSVRPDRAHIAPSADTLFESAAEVFGSRCAAVLLSGMGKDGAIGLLKVRNKGGKTFAQDRSSCTVFGMPEAAGRMGGVEAFAEPRAIAGYLRKLVEQPERIYE
jgi:two-component system, chemotaxis family, protein-glutamate methylesterase/glutaminase